MYEGNKRLFLALWPDTGVRRRIKKLIPAGPGRPVPAANLHITLVFLGNTHGTTAAQLINRIDRLHPRPFQLTLDSAGYWPRPGIVWLGMRQAPEELLSLVKSLRKCARQSGLKIETRAYRPHVTLTRKQREAVKEDEIKIDWQVDHFVLVESVADDGGVVYRVLHEWLLKPDH